MRHEDVELLGRIHKVNGVAGRMVLQVLSGVADDDALSADYDAIGRLFRGLGEAFIARSIELASPATELPPATREQIALAHKESCRRLVEGPPPDSTDAPGNT